MMPPTVNEKRKMGKTPNLKEKRQMIAIVAAETISVCRQPRRKHLSEIARRMVVAYPTSLRDELDGQVVGNGYGSWLKQLANKIDNDRRPEVSRK